MEKLEDKKIIKNAIHESIDKVLNEGIDFDEVCKVVSYNPPHEDNVDTSLEHNLTIDDIVPNIPVWTIFKRKRGMRGDGNPLEYALKGEHGWTFRSNKDLKDIWKQFNAIADKFVQMHPVGITILMPSDSELDLDIANVILSKSKNTELIEGNICEITTEEVEDIVLDFDSKFRKHYKYDFRSAFRQLGNYLDQMDEERDGTFARHLIKDSNMRDVIDITLKASEDRYAVFANKINGQDILIIDDTISRGQSIREAC